MSRGKYSRRQVLVATGGGIAGIAGVAGYRRWNRLASATHTQGATDDSPFDQVILDTIVDFLATFFGITVSPADRAELVQRLTLSRRADSNWRVEYQQLADIADRLALHRRQASFSAAPGAVRSEIVAEMLLPEETRRRRRIRAFFTMDGENFIRLQRSTVPHLARVYRTSGVPWRRRGYTSWPGVAGDTFAYARKPAMTEC